MLINPEGCLLTGNVQISGFRQPPDFAGLAGVRCKWRTVSIIKVSTLQCKFRSIRC